jgi:hypothetical protein
MDERSLHIVPGRDAGRDPDYADTPRPLMVGMPRAFSAR